VQKKKKITKDSKKKSTKASKNKMSLKEVLFFAKDIKISSRLLADCFLQLPVSCRSSLPEETLKWAERSGSNPEFSEDNAIDTIGKCVD
jgi:hypothetical protein